MTARYCPVCRWALDPVLGGAPTHPNCSAAEPLDYEQLIAALRLLAERLGATPWQYRPDAFEHDPST